MEFARVTINYVNLQHAELRISLNITAGELITKLSEIYKDNHVDVKAIQAEPLGRILDNTKTLAQEGVATGCLLTCI